MTDPTEQTRRAMTAVINAAPADRAALEAVYGRVWDATDLQADYEVTGFLAPFVVARRRSDGKLGSLMFQHGSDTIPGAGRFYFNWQPDDRD